VVATPIIPATWEVAIAGSIEANPGKKKVSETLSEK
jgi:hypothetical protein